MELLRYASNCLNDVLNKFGLIISKIDTVIRDNKEFQQIYRQTVLKNGYWTYGSTKHELKHLFPLVTKMGILILDDYGCWAGAKKAVDEYFINSPILLNRINETGRITVKVSG